jgi:hypothetical protein
VFIFFQVSQKGWRQWWRSALFDLHAIEIVRSQKGADKISTAILNKRLDESCSPDRPQPQLNRTILLSQQRSCGEIRLLDLMQRDCSWQCFKAIIYIRRIKNTAWMSSTQKIRAVRRRPWRMSYLRKTKTPWDSIDVTEARNRPSPSTGDIRPISLPDSRPITSSLKMPFRDST